MTTGVPGASTGRRSVYGHAAARGKSRDGLSLAVQPYAAAGLAAQSVRGIGVVQVEGVRSVFHEVELLRDLVRDEIHAFRSAQVSFLLLVSFKAAVYAVELPCDRRGDSFHFHLKEQLARLVGGKKVFRCMGGEPGRP